TAHPGNQAAAATKVPTLFCPTNPLSKDRIDGRDSAGYACADYTAVPYTQIDATGASTSSTFWATALTGKQYPLNLYTNFTTTDTRVASSKTFQLDTVANPGAIDALYGLPKIADIIDGTSQSITFYEDVGQNENMLGTTTPNGSNAGTPAGYLDPINGIISM